MVQLLAAPQSFNGVKVGIRGFVSFDFEGTEVCLSQSDYLNDISNNALWLSFTRDDDKLPTNDHQYCSVVGTFDATTHGHLGIFSGTLNVERIYGCEEPVASLHEKLLREAQRAPAPGKRNP